MLLNLIFDDNSGCEEYSFAECHLLSMRDYNNKYIRNRESIDDVVSKIEERIGKHICFKDESHLMYLDE